MKTGELFQSGDWSKEKHVPAIEFIEKKKENVILKISIGRDIPHPNKTEHHISWISVYFLPEGEKFPYEIGRYEFFSHGASVKGSDTSGVYSEPEIIIKFKTEKNGIIFVNSYCNIHGLWENSVELKL